MNDLDNYRIAALLTASPSPLPLRPAGVGNGRPRLPAGLFSDQFVAFVDSCLKKNPDERADLNSLIVSGGEGAVAWAIFAVLFSACSWLSFFK